MKIDISVIIPTYNVEKFIEDALLSVVKQKFSGSTEIIIIDDCSTDATSEIIEKFKKEHFDFPIEILYQEKNNRQGAARNRGLSIARGKYVFFLDGDDFLDENAFEHMFFKAENEECDFVLCDWVYYQEDKGLTYVNSDKFLFQDILSNEECESLLEAVTYFSVNKLYNKSFLIDNQIRYGEGYIYEDYEFYVEVAQKANKVAIIQNPYYRVRVNPESTTKANRTTTVHLESLVIAVQNTVDKFEPRKKESYYHLYKYIMKKTMDYIRNRAPIGFKKPTLKKIVTILNNKNVDYYVPSKLVPLFHFYFKRRLVQNGKVNEIIFIDNLQHKGYLRPLFSRAVKTKAKLIKIKNKKLKEKTVNRQKREIKSYASLPINNKLVLFLGFDYRYVGNSKYFFDYVVKNNKNDFTYLFVSKDERIPEEYRVEPRSMKFYKSLAQAKIVIAESWVPLDFSKKEGQKWIQLWHGTPFKKLLFDSHEYYVSSSNRNHKRNKQKDISKWDFLLSDSEIGKKKFSSAFAMEKDRILNYGYPRVQWLKENEHDESRKTVIKDSLNIPKGKKVVLYVPTWRDYNFKTKALDLSYALKLDKLMKLLGDEYIFINKEHSMGVSKKTSAHVIYPSDDVEVQELILISDLIISDYSSIIFDGLAINKPFYLLVNDFEKYKEARGVYEDMSDALKPFYAKDEEELANLILSTESLTFDTFDHLKKEYANIQNVNSSEMLFEKLKDLCN